MAAVALQLIWKQFFAFSLLCVYKYIWSIVAKGNVAGALNTIRFYVGRRPRTLIPHSIIFTYIYFLLTRHCSLRSVYSAGLFTHTYRRVHIKTSGSICHFSIYSKRTIPNGINVIVIILGVECAMCPCASL